MNQAEEPVEKKGSEFIINIDAAIVAMATVQIQYFRKPPRISGAINGGTLLLTGTL
jgi:hypothetical protein